jgi:hypothetical protein
MQARGRLTPNPKALIEHYNLPALQRHASVSFCRQVLLHNSKQQQAWVTAAACDLLQALPGLESFYST